MTGITGDQQRFVFFLLQILQYIQAIFVISFVSAIGKKCRIKPLCLPMKA